MREGQIWQKSDAQGRKDSARKKIDHVGQKVDIGDNHLTQNDFHVAK